eukprot:2759252-Pleurochrysis_carterae.AAC.3
MLLTISACTVYPPNLRPLWPLASLSTSCLADRLAATTPVRCAVRGARCAARCRARRVGQAEAALALVDDGAVRGAVRQYNAMVYGRTMCVEHQINQWEPASSSSAAARFEYVNLL